ncbi:MAG: hypothetical protein JJU02_06450 [Cryomorphaceae bacterium]|nr:hypothetical protein [Cryomorphaceae bacterium]
MTTHLKFIGIVLMVLALIHVIFPKYFQWKTNLSSLSLINRQMMMVHTFFIALTVFLIGFLCLTSADDLVNTPLGKRLSFGLAIFWTIRLFVQFFVYSNQLWRGKPFETIVHIVFSAFWLYISLIFWITFTI